MPTDAPAADTALAIIAAAASPDERAAGECFVTDPLSDSGVIAAREREWQTAVAGGDADAWARVLSARRLTERRVRAGLANVVVADAGRLPPWARELCILLAGPPSRAPTVEPLRLGDVFGDDTLAHARADRDAVWSAHRLFEPFLRIAAARLEQILAASRANVAPTARRNMLAQLAARWSSLAAQTLYHRIDVVDLLDGLPGALGSTVYDVHCAGAAPALDQWRSVFEVYPVLGRLMAVAHLHWAGAIRRLVRRLSRDRSLLAGAFAGGGDLGALAGYSADAGDAHDRGQTVSVLTFEHGCRVVYKPKDLRIAAWYMALVDRLNDEGLTPPLPRRRILPRGAYTWEEFVVAGSCGDRDAVRRFYRRMGMHARLVQLLDGTDFTTDNVLPCGEDPVLVDLEMLLSPHLRLPKSIRAEERAAQERAWDSPSRSGLVSAKIAGEPGRRPADVGALAPASSRLAPFRQTALCRAQDGSMSLSRDYPRFDGNSATPMLNGQSVRPEEFYGDVIDGYLRMTACLRRAAPRLFGDRGMLDAVGPLPVRLLWRDTHIYARLLSESLRPHRLRDGVSREICLERLWKAGVESPAVTQCEIGQLRDLDIPLFVGHPSDDIVRGAGLTAHGCLEGTSLQRCRRRAAALPNGTGMSAAEQIRTALFLLTPGRTAAPAVPAPPRMRAGDWLEEAVRIGDFIVGEAISTRGGTMSWVGLGYDPWTDAWALGPLQPDLLSGTAGLAIVLADLGRVSGESRFSDAARLIVSALADRLDGLAATLGTKPRRSGSSERPRCGAFIGWGAWLYACLRVGRVMRDDDLTRRASRFMEGIQAEAVRQDGSGVVAGMAGLLTVLAGDPGAPRHVPNAIGHSLLEEWSAEGGFRSPAFPVGGTVLRSLPSNEAGACLALLRLARWSGDARFAEPWRAWTRGESRQRAPECSGAVLALFAELGAGGEDVERAARAAHRFVRAMDHAATTGEILETAEVAITAYQYTDEPAFADAAAGLGRRMLGIRRSSGRWFPELLSADRFRLSALTGIGAIAHLFLRVEDPLCVASLRLLS
jgi:type 2 lantibiotic biosynthesis protein LanM